MAYKINVSVRAQKEIENAIDFYALHSNLAPENFIAALNEAYASLEISSFSRIVYKNVRILKLRKFPYSLFYVIDESRNSIQILACFHNKRNPTKRP